MIALKTNSRKFKFVLIVVLILVLNIFYGCNNNIEESEGEVNSESDLNSIIINVTVDKRVELMAVIQYLADFELKYNGHIIPENRMSRYRDKVRSYFSQYENHPAVSLYEKMAGEGFIGDASASFSLYLDSGYYFNSDNLTERVVESRLRRWGGVDGALEFSEAMRNFANDTKFEEFYNEQAEIHSQAIENMQEVLPLTEMAKLLTDYYGFSYDSYTIIISHLSTSGTGPGILNATGGYDLYCLCPTTDTMKDPVEMVLHEFSHPYLNPMIDQNLYEFSTISDLYIPIKDLEIPRVYGSWITVAKEHMVRAATARLKYHLLDKDAAEKELTKQEEKGFIYVRPLYEKLKEYEKNRKQYPTINDFFPELVKAFRRLAM